MTDPTPTAQTPADNPPTIPQEEPQAPQEAKKSPDPAPKTPPEPPGPVRPPRTYLVKSAGRNITLSPRSALTRGIDCLAGRLEMSKRERAVTAKILEAQVDRLMELQRAYDDLIPYANEIDLEKNPQRYPGEGVLMRWELESFAELAWVLQRIIMRPTSWPAADVLKGVDPAIYVTSVMYPRVDFLRGLNGGLFSCVFRLGSKPVPVDPVKPVEPVKEEPVVAPERQGAGELKPADRPLDAHDRPVEDRLEVGPGEPEVGGAGVDVGPNSQQ